MPSIFCYQNIYLFRASASVGGSNNFQKKKIIIKNMEFHGRLIFSLSKRFVLLSQFRDVMKAHTKNLLCLDRPLPHPRPRIFSPGWGFARATMREISYRWYLYNVPQFATTRLQLDFYFPATATLRNRVSWIEGVSSLKKIRVRARMHSKDPTVIEK